MHQYVKAIEDKQRKIIELEQMNHDLQKRNTELVLENKKLKNGKTLKDWQKEIHQLMKEKGWWEKDKDPKLLVPEKLLLKHSEISEAVEEYRKGNMGVYFGENNKPEGFIVEIVDDLYRTLDLCEALGYNLECVLRLKHEYNKTRSHRHGDKKI